MYLTSEKKREIFEKYLKAQAGTGYPESHIALLAYRSTKLTEHLKSNHND